MRRRMLMNYLRWNRGRFGDVADVPKMG